MFDGVLSISGQKWVYQKADENQVEFLMQKLNLPYIVCRMMAARGITPDDAQSFLDPKLQNLMPDPSSLKDMDKAAAFLADAIEAKKSVGIIGDYDADGATSSAILRRYLESFGLKVCVHIPERDEGYGPSMLAFEKFEEQSIKTVVTTDCGTTAFDVLDAATEKGFDIIVLDHHEAEVRLPHVFGVVNPKRLDETGSDASLKYLAAVGVVFLTLVAVNRELQNRSFFKTHDKPDLRTFLDLVALGTVCDVVPLLGLNRAYVKQGLKVIASRQNLGLTTLIDHSGIREKPTVYHLGYVLGPRINAGGRVGESDAGHRLLCTKNNDEALKLAEKLNQFNAERKDIEAYVLKEAIEQLEKEPQEYKMAFAFGENWHQGVIGIVAGKLKERYHLPAFVMDIEPDEVKGSARSVDGLDLGMLILAAKEKGLLLHGGGHTLAAGFSLSADKIDDFKKFAGEYISSRLSLDELTPNVNFDAVITLEGATLDVAEKIELLAPFGASHPEPKVVIEKVKIVQASVVGDGHVRCFIANSLGKGRLKAICFKCVDHALGQALLNANDRLFNVLGTLKVDSWMNTKNVQLVIDDLMEVSNNG